MIVQKKANITPNTKGMMYRGSRFVLGKKYYDKHMMLKGFG